MHKLPTTNDIVNEVIRREADALRTALIQISNPNRQFYDFDAYLEAIIEGYRHLYRMIKDI
jgi:hypothetical protein